MSNLNSVFDTLRGWPNGSALEASFDPDTGITLAEGTIVDAQTRQLADATVLRIVDDSLVTAPALAAADRGKAYHVAGTGGDWSGFSIGDIVEWDGSAWNLVLAGSGGTPVGPPDGTRAVVVESGAAGSFAGEEEKVMVFTTGAPGSWAVADTPADGNRIKIVGTDSVYQDQYFDYQGTHPAGVWGKAARQIPAPAIASKLTSPAKSGNQKPDAWMVIQGNDQFDGIFTNKVTCVKLASGSVVKMATTIADTLSVGDLVTADAGALKKLTVGAGMEWPIGQILESNSVAGSGGIVTVATY